MLYESEGGWFLKKDLKLEPRKSLSTRKTESVLVLLEGARIFQLRLKPGTLAIRGLRGLCDFVETAFLEPSCNTDQGVKQTCEFAGVKPIGEMKVSIRCQAQAAASTADWLLSNA